MADPDFSRNVFVNCPFDWDYDPILKAILFCLVRFGLRPRIATERSNAGESRIEKISELILASEYSIHDLSRCEAQTAGERYRMNMPFELGMDFACRRFAGEPFARKKILVMEEQRYRYQAALSDLAGIDIVPHEGKYELAVKAVRDWLAGMPDTEKIADRKILGEYEDFQEWYAERLRIAGFVDENMLNVIRAVQVAELLQAMVEWNMSGRPRL